MPTRRSLKRALWSRSRWNLGLVTLILVLCGWFGWKKYELNSAVEEMRAAGCLYYTALNPLDIVREDWHAAFRRKTWTGGQRLLWVPRGSDLGRYKNSIRRLNPTYLVIKDGGESLHNLDDLEGLTNLQQLYLNNCLALNNVNVLMNFAGLQRLFIIHCPTLESVNALQGLTSLQDVRLVHCTALTDVEALKGLVELQWLDLTGSTNLSLSALHELHTVLSKTEILFPDATRNPPK